MIVNQKSDRSLEIQHSGIFTKNLAAFEQGYRYIINTGGSRSSKTYSILQLLIFICLTKPGIKISIVRQSLPSLRKSSMYDFFQILESLNIYSDKNHQKTENYYKFPNGSFIEFFGVVDEQRVRGAKRDILFCNEANELSFKEFNQLMMRTTTCCILDRNPSEVDHWIDDLQKDEKSYSIHSTYKDNPFLPQSQIDYINSLINVDENFYRIYALGLAPNGNTRIYSHFKQYSDVSDIKDFAYGLDFGYNHPSVLVKCSWNDSGVYIEELIYKSGLTISDLITLIKESVNTNRPIYCDSARPEIIEQLKRSGFNARGSNKNVKEGIDTVKSSQVYIQENSQNVWKEYRTYSWKTDNDKVTDVPIKLNDDAMDAIRYCIHTHRYANKTITTKRFFY